MIKRFFRDETGLELSEYTLAVALADTDILPSQKALIRRWRVSADVPVALVTPRA